MILLLLTPVPTVGELQYRSWQSVTYPADHTLLNTLASKGGAKERAGFVESPGRDFNRTGRCATSEDLEVSISTMSICP
ncbi:MAG: hypothetical protein M3P08_18945 [Thermoproteota archaeon]|nr:hypothetical protein [Thermoproteota archaeon]